jgi:hypothetical protein
LSPFILTNHWKDKYACRARKNGSYLIFLNEMWAAEAKGDRYHEFGGGCTLGEHGEGDMVSRGGYRSVL